MPTPLELPYPPLVLIESDEPLSWRELQTHVGNRLRGGVSICLQSTKGHDNRGGYFFHLQKTQVGYVFRTFDRLAVLAFDQEDDVIAFINHCSGRGYDEAMWAQAQLVNFRTDEDSAC